MHNISLSYYGYFTPFGGYGIANFNWVKHLRRAGVSVFPHGKFLPKPGEKEWDVLNAEEREIAQLPFEKQRIGIIETTPFDFNTIKTDIKIANTMAENDTLGKPWVKACNGMDYVVVPNAFQRDVFLNSGVKNVHVIPHGTETEKFPYYDRPKRNNFTFGIVGYLNDRKGVFDVIQAFASEFGHHEPVQLILKSSNPDFGYYRNFNHPHIYTNTALMTPDALNRLYQKFDCFVFPSKAEGIGQPPREAMATGLPCIVGNYSGLEEIAKKEFAYPLNPVSFKKRDGWVEQPGNWAYYDIAELMYLMRYIYEHPEEAKEKGKAAATEIRTNHSWQIAATRMKDFISKL
jgi:glycosyltransferase involved in cell wall biosynthesis